MTPPVSDDGIIGGGSAPVPCATSYVNYIHDTTSPVPHLQWSSVLSTAINTRSGFGALMTPEFPLNVPLGNRYGWLEIRRRVDWRMFAVNLKVMETYFQEYLYQGFLGKEGIVVVNANDDNGVASGGDHVRRTVSSPNSLEKQQQLTIHNTQ